MPSVYVKNHFIINILIPIISCVRGFCSSFTGIRKNSQSSPANRDIMNIELFFLLQKPLKQGYTASGEFKIETWNVQLLPAPVLTSPSYYVNVFFPRFCVFFPILFFFPWIVSDESGVAVTLFCCKQGRHCNTCCCCEYAGVHGSLRWVRRGLLLVTQ